jgi:hypothetical protein
MDALLLVNKIKRTVSGGSSRILSMAFRAESCILSAFSIITVLRLPHRSQLRPDTHIPQHEHRSFRRQEFEGEASE